jgi:hypothetical protein
VVSAVLALSCTAVTGLVHPQPAAAAAKFAQPITGVTWRAGETQTIIWSDASPGPQPLTLLKGSPAARAKARGPVDHSTGPLNCCALGRIRTCNLLIRSSRRIGRLGSYRSL